MPLGWTVNGIDGRPLTTIFESLVSSVTVFPAPDLELLQCLIVPTQNHQTSERFRSLQYSLETCALDILREQGKPTWREIGLRGEK